MTASANDIPAYKNPAIPMEERVESLLALMTLEEKVAQVSGADHMDTRTNERLGIPALKMTDGPHGVRWEKATCFPTAVAWGASWDPELMHQIAVALADETRAKGRNVLLGPCVNIHRTPLGGRNFESFTEDPFLAARMAVAYVKGVQSRKVATSTKHFACNNQEWERGTINAEVDERALREIYLPAFKAAVQEADTWTVMGAYNRLNGPFCCASKPMLTDLLKNEWGFQGLVMSDWCAVHETVGTANAGLDLEMPGPGEFFGHGHLLKAVQEGAVSEAILDNKVRRILRVMFRMGLFDGIETKHKGALDTPGHRALARTAAAQGMVLLKNQGPVLPLNAKTLKSIALIGPHVKEARLGGGGSSSVTPFYAVTPLEGLQQKLGNSVELRIAQGCVIPGRLEPLPSELLLPPPGKEGTHGLWGEYFSNKDLEGKPVLQRLDAQVNFDWGNGSPAPEIPGDGFSARWTGRLVVKEDTSCDLGITSDDGCRLYLDDQLLLDYWIDQGGITRSAPIELKAGHEYNLRVEYFENTGEARALLGWVVKRDVLREAVEAARDSDVAIVFAGISYQQEGEGVDRTSLGLPEGQDEMIAAVARANPRTVVVLNSGTPLLMDKWLNEVAAVLEAWYPGQEGGNAIAEVLLGGVNPSGKLPVTFPKRLEDSPSHPYYPGGQGVVRYEEGLRVGYRHFDTEGVEPLFPFGHGLSYTTFTYSDLRCALKGNGPSAHVQMSLQNSGQRAGAEVVQLYIRPLNSTVFRPFQELKGFQKVLLQPGETRQLEFLLDEMAFSYYDPQKKGWTLEPGDYEVRVGSSSRDIRLKGTLKQP